MNNVIDVVKQVAKTNPTLDYYRTGFETDELKLVIENDGQLNVTRVGLAQEELNVYFDGFMDGRVIIKAENSPFGAGESHPVRLYRKLTIIEGGVLKLGMFALGDDVVDLTVLSLVDPDMEIPNSLDFAEKLLSIEVMKARYKVLNYFIKKIRQVEDKSNLKPDEFEWFKARGFVGGSYNPPKTEKQEKEYKHRAATTVKGWSALPSVEELMEVTKSKAKTGPRVEMRRAYEQYSQLDSEGLYGELGLLTGHVSNVTRYVAEVKLAITVCGKWFPDAVLFPRQKLICSDGTPVFLDVINRVES